MEVFLMSFAKLNEETEVDLFLHSVYSAFLTYPCFSFVENWATEKKYWHLHVSSVSVARLKLLPNCMKGKKASRNHN